MMHVGRLKKVVLRGRELSFNPVLPLVTALVFSSVNTT